MKKELFPAKTFLKLDIFSMPFSFHVSIFSLKLEFEGKKLLIRY